MKTTALAQSEDTKITESHEKSRESNLSVLKPQQEIEGTSDHEKLQDSDAHILNFRQEQARILLASGKTITQTAEEVGVIRECVSRWWNKDPDFRKQVGERRAEIYDKYNFRLHKLVEAALESVEKGIGDPKLALDILKQVKFFAALSLFEQPETSK
jgi:transposase-like protein